MERTAAPTETHASHVKYRVAYTDPRGTRREATFKRRENAVLFLDTEKTKILGLVSPRRPAAPFVVGPLFAPFVLTSDELADALVKTAIERRDA